MLGNDVDRLTNEGKRPVTIAEALSRAIVSGRNAEASGNTVWVGKWRKRIADIMDGAPYGSGFDNGTPLGNSHKQSDRRLTFVTSFHHMSEHGFYTEWTEHLVTIEATFNGLGVKVSGRNRNDIKDYIAEVFGIWLSADAPEMV